MSLADMKFGAAPATDTGFRVLCMLLAQHPSYSRLPVARVTDILDSVLRKQNFCAVQEGKLVGAVIWTTVSDDTAREAIRAQRMPAPADVLAGGPALVLTAFLAPAAEQVRPFWDRFVQQRAAGRIILTERHYADKPSHFVWCDRQGRRMGRDL